MAQLPQVRYGVITLEGGYDLITPTLQLKPGACRDALNFEASVTGGYTRIKGYERNDGRTAPSSAQFTILVVPSSAGVAVGNTVNNAVTATAQVIAVTPTTVVVTKVVNSFTAGQTLRVGVSNIGVISQVGLGVSSLLNATYAALAADVYRADILVVPGSGPVRGVQFYNGVLYAWRDNVGATAQAIYKSTTGGWVNVALGFELSFTAGLAAGIVEGNTVTGLTSGATGVVSRVLVQSGTFAANTAAGRLILSATAGTFVAAETLRVAGTNRATASGAATAITLLPGGRVRTRLGSFGGGTGANRIYGCDSTNRGFEFDGTVYAPISTGQVNDRPQRLAVHASRLFFSFGSSLQFSSVVSPYQWTPLTGAGELAMNADITDLLSLPGSTGGAALLVAARKNTKILYGNDSSTWQLVDYSTGIGALSDTAQRIEQTYAFSERGIIQLDVTQNYGNFDTSTLTLNIRPFIESRRTQAVAGGLNRDKSQYRVFFADGFALYATIVNGTYMGSMPIFFPNAVTCWCEGEAPDGSETSFFGSSNGFVYRLDAGTSHDGVVIDYRFLLNYAHLDSPRIKKRFMRASIEATGNSFASFGFSYELGYTSSQITQPGTIDYSSPFQAVNWDGFTWDMFVWDGKTIGPTEVAMNGSAENVAVRISGRSAIFDSFTINSVILHHIPRRGLRG